MLKAAREAKVHTRAGSTRTRSTRRRSGVRRSLLARRRHLFLDDLRGSAARIARFGALNSLRSALKLAVARRAGLLPGHRDRRPRPGRSGQPAARRLRAAASACSSRSRRCRDFPPARGSRVPSCWCGRTTGARSCGSRGARWRCASATRRCSSTATTRRSPSPARNRPTSSPSRGGSRAVRWWPLPAGSSSRSPARRDDRRSDSTCGAIPSSTSRPSAMRAELVDVLTGEALRIDGRQLALGRAFDQFPVALLYADAPR